MKLNIPTLNDIYELPIFEIPDSLGIPAGDVLILEDMQNAVNFYHLGVRKEFRVAKKVIKGLELKKEKHPLEEYGFKF